MLTDASAAPHAAAGADLEAMQRAGSDAALVSLR